MWLLSKLWRALNFSSAKIRLLMTMFNVQFFYAQCTHRVIINVTGNSGAKMASRVWMPSSLPEEAQRWHRAFGCHRLYRRKRKDGIARLDAIVSTEEAQRWHHAFGCHPLYRRSAMMASRVWMPSSLPKRRKDGIARLDAIVSTEEAQRWHRAFGCHRLYRRSAKMASRFWMPSSLPKKRKDGIALLDAIVFPEERQRWHRAFGCHRLTEEAQTIPYSIQNFTL